ncbi:MAG: hypothetical protein ACI39E_01610 [Acutalibacteraceae bacterium]
MSNKSYHDDRTRGTARAAGCNQAACIDAGRVFDSCSDRDCAEDLRVYFVEADQQRIDRAVSVRAKRAEVLSTCIDVESLPFQDGYYSCDLTFFIEVQIELYEGCDCPCTLVRGCCIFEKRVILYGGEGRVQVFSSEFRPDCHDHQEMPTCNMPRCCVQVAEPVALDARLVEACNCRARCCGNIPVSVCNRFGGRFTEDTNGKIVLVTIGIFSIVQMVRNVQLLVPVYDYCVPCKSCECDDENPCDLFKKMSFPMEEFFPPMCTLDRGGSCKCDK